MATDVEQKDLEKIQTDNEKLLEQIADQERKLSEVQNQAALTESKRQLTGENDRLKARLADLKAQVTAQRKSDSPSDQAAAAAKAEAEAVTTVPGASDDDTKGK